jgi:hypothetical protein
VLNPAPPQAEKDEMKNSFIPLHIIRRGFFVLNIHPEFISGSVKAFC